MAGFFGTVLGYTHYSQTSPLQLRRMYVITSPTEWKTTGVPISETKLTCSYYLRQPDENNLLCHPLREGKGVLRKTSQSAVSKV